MKFIALLVISLVLIPCALGLGITPTSRAYDFEPNAVIRGSISIINSDERDGQMVITTQGAIAQYIFLREALVDMKAKETREIEYQIRMPSAFEKPGVQAGQIVVTRLPSKDANEGAFVGSAVSISTDVKVRVPYPGKYAETRLDISEANTNQTVTFILPVANLGIEDITVAKGTIEVLGPTNNNIGTVLTNQKPIKAKKSDELSANWLASVEPGIYMASATLTYDEKVLALSRTFAVGSLVVDIVSATVKDFKLGGIAKITLAVKNKWNSEVPNLYAQLYVYDNQGTLLSDTKSPSINLAAQSTDALLVYWDTQGLPSGTYQAKVVLNYAGKKTEKPLRLVVGSTSMDAQLVGATGQVIAGEPGKASPISVFLVVQILFIIANIGLVIFFVIRMRKKKQ